MNEDGDQRGDIFDTIAGTAHTSDRIPTWKRKIIERLGGSVTSSVPRRQKLSKRQRKELRNKKDEFFITSAQELLANNTNDSFFIDSSRKLLVQQRIMDDTKARRRLERWARNTIIIYLLIVFLLVILNGLSQIIWNSYFKEHGFISDTVMTVILSTTTINIIGLGVIVLKGHFPNYTHEDVNATSDSNGNSPN